MSLVKGKNENDILNIFKSEPTKSILECLETILPKALIVELSKLVEVDLRDGMLYLNAVSSGH